MTYRITPPSQLEQFKRFTTVVVDSGAMVARGHRLMGRYQAAGVPRERVPVKIAVTWEGIAAVRHDEAGFRFELGEDAMATQKLAEGVRGFVRDARALDAPIHATRA
jgi:transaldolase